MDIYIADYSSTLFEAMICNVPTIFFNHGSYWSKNTTINYSLNESAFELTDKNELLPVIERILYEPSYRSELINKQNDYFNENIFNLGCATKCIADYVLKHCQ